MEREQVVEVAILACGAPRRGMGWYHAKQLLEGRVTGAKLTDIVEPFFLTTGKETQAGQDFARWAAAAEASGVRLHQFVAEVPVPQVPKLAVVCGRTVDNPQLVREAIDHGFSHIFLEKPGAPTVKELEDLDAYAESKGVPVYMGFNRNFSKYILAAKEHLGTVPAGSSLLLVNKNSFDTSEALDECFERNSEGIIKNMMIHELVVLISHFGVSCDTVRDIVIDRNLTCMETRKGFSDMSKIGLSIVVKSGREFKIRLDRQNGEVSEAAVMVNGEEAFRASRPDPEIAKVATEIEEAEPGIMPYFAMQDGEYIVLKQRVVDHMLHGQHGSVPDGVATLAGGIEGLRLADRIATAAAAAARGRNQQL